MSAPSALAIGSVIQERYKLLWEIGRGGYGRVYKAEQLATGQHVAVKVLVPRAGGDEADHRADVARFDREMKLIGQVSHPNIVKLIDSGRLDDGSRFIVLDYVRGEALASIIRRGGPLPVRQTQRLMSQVLEALDCAHAYGVIHRDLKPQNIMVTDPGSERSNAIVLDFGIADVIEEARDEDYRSLTGRDQIAGTPAYMAPEQLLKGTASAATDLFSWGLVFYESLTGRPAISETSIVELVLFHTQNRAVDLSEVVRGSIFGPVLTKAMATDPADRYATAEEALADLERISLDRTQGERLDAQLAAAWREAKNGEVGSGGTAGGAEEAGQIGEAWDEDDDWEETVDSLPIPDSARAVAQAQQLASEPPSPVEDRLVPEASADAPTDLQPLPEAPPDASPSTTPSAVPARRRSLVPVLVGGAVLLLVGAVVLIVALVVGGDDDGRAVGGKLAAQPGTGRPVAGGEATPASAATATALGSVHVGPTIPPAAEVLVDGQSLGPAPVSGEGLRVGRHHLVVRAEGYYQHERAVAIRPGDIYQEVLDLVLKPMDAIMPAEDMVRIAPGSFLMGCNATADDECTDSERPAREIQLDGYEIDRTEVTVLAYQVCVADGACDPPVRYAPGRYEACNWGHPERLDHPVNCITWSQAERYCMWRGTRLPTEAEWEHAARGRLGQRFPWGDADASCELAVLSLRDCPHEHTEPVGSLPDGQSPYGLLDMAGNVEEWTADWYGTDYYHDAPNRNPTGPVEGYQGRRSSRGGGFDDTPDEVRASARDGEIPDDPDDDMGFRCARSVAE